MSNRTRTDSAVTQLLITGRLRISDEKNWCQRRLKLGGRVCAAGAISTEIDLSSLEMQAIEFLHRAALALGDTYDAVNFNDTHTHSEVLQMYDLAIEMSRGER